MSIEGISRNFVKIGDVKSSPKECHEWYEWNPRAIHSVVPLGNSLKQNLGPQLPPKKTLKKWNIPSSQSHQWLLQRQVGVSLHGSSGGWFSGGKCLVGCLISLKITEKLKIMRRVHKISIWMICGTLRSLEIGIKIISIFHSHSQCIGTYIYAQKDPFMQTIIAYHGSNFWCQTRLFACERNVLVLVWDRRFLPVGGWWEEEIGRVHFAVICLDRFIVGNKIW